MDLILVDTSVWVDHLRRSVPELGDLIRSRRCVLHPYVLAELALGNLADRPRRLSQLAALPTVDLLSVETLLEHIEALELPGSGLGMVDATLLATAAAARGGMSLWSTDRRLAERARALGLAWAPEAFDRPD